MLIPLSLYVSIELIKLGQVFLIHNDIHLYDPVSNKRLECRALNIPEELGQVQYIFSDKTGTLTENNMIFRRCTIGGIDYNHHHPSVSDCKYQYLSFLNSGSISAVNIKIIIFLGSEVNQCDDKADAVDMNKANNDGVILLNDRLQRELIQMETQLIVDRDPSHIHLTPHNHRIQDFFLLMAVCNTVVVSKYPHQDKVNKFAFANFTKFHLKEWTVTVLVAQFIIFFF